MTDKKYDNFQIICGKWKPLIIFNLYNGRKRFTELTEGISQKVLCENLASLEKHNLVDKEHFYEYPPRVEYFLTSKGYEYARVLKGFENIV